MNSEIKKYWELYFVHYSNDKIIRQNNNPIREYEDELIEGAIIDIGCGQSSFLLDFAHSHREIIAVDSEQLQLDYLMERVKSFNSANISNWSFNHLNFPEDPLPKKEYSLIILSNILHFFPLSKCIEIGKLICSMSKKGTLVYIAVHSNKFYANKPENPQNYDYYKHYFSKDDFEKIFQIEDFEKIYYSEIEKKDSIAEIEFTEKWIDSVLIEQNADNPALNEQKKMKYMQNNSQADIVAIFKKT